VIDILGGSKHTHRPPRSGEPKPPANIPKCPKHLDKEARQEWKRMAKELEPLGLLTNIDKAVFANYCEAYSTWAQASMKIREQGMVFKTSMGLPLVNPYFRIADKAKIHMMKALVEIGMSPSSRARVKVSEMKPKEEDKRERFFR
jgi:P27 family predicted phage terminase small subunit